MLYAVTCLDAIHTSPDGQMFSSVQEVNSQWEPADLLPHRSQAIAPHAPVSAGQTTDLRAARAAAMAAAAAGGSDDQRSRSAPLLRHAQHFRAPAPARDPQAGKCPPEQHMLKLLRDAQEAGECAFLVFPVAVYCLVLMHT